MARRHIQRREIIWDVDRELYKFSTFTGWWGARNLGPNSYVFGVHGMIEEWDVLEGFDARRNSAKKGVTSRLGT